MAPRLSRWTARAAALLLLAGAVADPVAAYERPVHRKVSETAFERVVTDTGLLEHLGLKPTDEFEIPSVRSGARTAVQWVGQGSEDEDDAVRVLNHFYDPTTGQGLAGGTPAPAWATAPLNFLGLPNGKRFLYEALTDPSPAAQEDAWGKFFYILGHVIHLVQDMASPQHTRDDEHLHPGLEGAAWDEAFSDYSRYERHTLGEMGSYLYDGYPTVRLPSYTAYFDDGEGRGLAEFSNSQFVSEDTNLDTGLYPSPAEAGGSFDVTEEETVSVWVEVPGPAPSFERQDRTVKVLYRSYGYVDGYRGDIDVNPRLTAFSFFDFIHRQLNSSRAYTLTSKNFDQHANILLPRAVGYSAGLIEHLFRGRIEIAPPDAGVYGAIDQQRGDAEVARFEELRMKLRNVTPPIQVPGEPPLEEEMTGGTVHAIVTYHPNGCYDDDLGGEFDAQGIIPNGCTFTQYRGPETTAYSAPMAVGTIPRNSPVELSFDFSGDPIPVSARDVSLRLVYRGGLGAHESDAVVTETKDLSEPTFLGWINSTDYYNLNGTFYRPEDIVADPVLLAQVDPDPVTAAAEVQPTALVDARISVGGTELARTASLPVGGYTRIAVLTDPGTFNVTIQRARSLGPSTSNLEASWSYFDEEARVYHTSFIDEFRGLRGYYRAIGINQTGLVAADPSTLPPIPAPFFVPSDIGF